jgi:predicted RNase H-like nuclease (RuvC/YqgF family)
MKTNDSDLNNRARRNNSQQRRKEYTNNLQLLNEKRNLSMQKRLLNRNTNTNFKTNKNLYKTFNYDTEATEKIRAKMESEKKEYEEKIRMMINHISAMKRQQEDVARKINFLKQKEENLNNAKREKENARNNIGAGTPVDVVDNLTTEDATKALSAKQGKVLKALVDTKPNVIVQTTDPGEGVAIDPNTLLIVV